MTFQKRVFVLDFFSSRLAREPHVKNKNAFLFFVFVFDGPIGPTTCRRGGKNLRNIFHKYFCETIRIDEPLRERIRNSTSSMSRQPVELQQIYQRFTVNMFERREKP